MKRSHESGAKKRKAAQEKKRKDENLLNKIPKISDIFSATSSKLAESDATTNTSCVGSIAEQSEAEQQIGELKHEEQEQDIGILDENSDIGEAESIETEAPIPTDPAAWCMDKDINYLQSYWAKHGSFQVCKPQVLVTI